jgi:hypothetical protein
VQVSGIEYTIRCDCNQNQTGCCAEARGFGEFPPACADNILINGQPLSEDFQYEVGANDYMARGGSGFQMLRRNTTQQDSGISLRDAVEEWMRKQPPCTENDLSALGVCDRDKDPDSLRCEYDDLAARLGPANIPCLIGSGLVDGRVTRVLPK